MNIKVAFRCAAVFVASGLLFAGSAFAQTSGIFKVSDAIEGPPAAGVTAARCGTNIVVGFSDSESGNPNSADGFAVSKDGGKTFADLGTLPVAPPGPDAFGPNTLGVGPNTGPGNPAVACANSSQFYYASVYTSTDPICTFPFCTAISVSSSTDGGSSWGLPVVAAVLTADTDTLAWPSLAVDPTNPLRLYLAYINNNHDAPFFFDDCLGNPQMILDFATSSDGGKTWSGQSQLDHSCLEGGSPPPLGSLTTPNLAVSPTGEVYVAYALAGSSINGEPPVNEIRFTHSSDHGNTFSAPMVVSRTATGNATPQLAVDRTNSPHRGEIYLTWSGAPAGTYTSVLESDSLNAGESFSFPRQINGTPGAGLGRFQANPAIAVDNDGQAQICYYNTPTNTPTSTSVYSYNCATSFNHAATWQLQRVANSAPVGYDAVTSDFLTHHDGFFNAFELQTNGVSHVAGQFSDIN